MNIFSRFLDKDVAVLRNKVSHVLVEYEKARATIRKAKQKFEATRDATAKDFNNMKKTAFTDTLNAVGSAKAKADADRAKADKAYAEATSKHATKTASLDSLHSLVSSLGSQEHPLD